MHDGHTGRLESILDAIGGTPMVPLRRLSPADGARVWAKCEFLNPGGSAKDRIGLALVEAAERSGALRPGGTLVEASSGNTAVALAQVAAVKGYRLVIAMPEKMSDEKRRLVRAYGAELILTPNVAPDHPDHYTNVARRFAARTPGAVYLDQFGNPANRRAHVETTGPEIWRQLDGRISAVIAGVGTGGTLSGAAAYLKARDPRIRIVCVDPEGSILSGGEPRPYLVEGIGDDFVPPGLDQSLVDKYVRVSDAECFAWTRRLAREEGILAGGSSGAAVLAAYRTAQSLPRDANVVAILPDTGRNYLSKLYDDAWLQRHCPDAAEPAATATKEALPA